jgi:hypothetical protein
MELEALDVAYRDAIALLYHDLFIGLGESESRERFSAGLQDARDSYAVAKDRINSKDCP